MFFSSTTTATGVAIVLGGLVLPMVLLGLVAILTLWSNNTKEREQKSSKAALLVGGPAIASAFVFLVVDLLWLSSLLEAYPSEATIVNTTLEYVDNAWRSTHYGDGYTIGDDQYVDMFCVPYDQFALARLRIECPLKTCTSEILIWDCESRDVCREDCQAMVDDGQYHYQCANMDGTYDDDGGGNDDNNNDDDEYNGQQQWTEEELLECAEAAYPTGDVLSSVKDENGTWVPPFVTDCTKCLSLSRQDYEWVLDQEHYGSSTRWGKNHHRVGRVVGSLVGLFLGCAAMVLYRMTDGGTTPLAILDKGDENHKKDEWKDENDFHRIEER